MLNKCLNTEMNDQQRLGEAVTVVWFLLGGLSLSLRHKGDQPAAQEVNSPGCRADLFPHLAAVGDLNL